MHGDFSNVTFDPAERYSRVLQQQGRVTLDADTNEGGALLLHALRALTRDLVGPHGGPETAFRIGLVRDENGDPVPRDLQAARGNYYVEGVRCEALERLRYTEQADHLFAPKLEPATAYLVYVDVWERWISFLQDPLLREVALAGPDTAGRAQIIRQLRTYAIDDDLTVDTVEARYRELVEKLQPANRGLLRARARYDLEGDEPCIAPPEAQYRGPENQLYRVEVLAPADQDSQLPATFVWSRDNGSVAFAVLDLDADAGSGRTTLTLDGLHPDAQRGLAPGDWVEARDDADDLDGVALGWTRRLNRVLSVDALESTVVVDGIPDLTTRFVPRRHPIVRRWDHDGDPDLDGALAIEEGTSNEVWLEIEDGVEVQFVATPDNPARYRPGDYWLIPARTAIADVLWPQDASGDPEARAPTGIVHVYAPLAAVRLMGDGTLGTGAANYLDLRRTFSYIAT